ncbi:uncharacterized protein LOC119883035 [Micropterus salmoides]|uniref:uncharacterized protein LOC119883035 n=1 Tax=Micropterus salmoides TaxID=27706 RepID=UPI0018EAB0F7|nr:uncharacterized protein LOC119883035 [Micropterus salmoides]
MKFQQKKRMIIVAILLILSLYWILRLERILKNLTTSYKAPTKKPVQLKFPPHCGSGYVVPEGEKVAVKSTKTVLLSAYREHRTGQNEVRVISVMLREKTEAYRCHLCCQEKLHISKSVTSLHSDHFGFKYGTADIMCPVPSDCETPSHIAVTSAADDSEDKLDKEFFEVKNQKSNSGSFPYNFTLCLSAMFDFTNVLQLVQSLEMVQLLGVNRVAIYKTNCSSEAQRILDYYTHKGLVEVIPWSLSRFLNVSRGWLPEHGPGDLHYFGQIAALNDCVYRYMYQSRYVALHDIDELILPQTVDSWLELFPLLQKKYDHECYIFENNVFPSTNFSPPTSKLLWNNVTGVNILAQLYHIPLNEKTKYDDYKIIVNPRGVFSATVHGLLSSQNDCSWVDRNIARMYHTRAGTKTELKPDQLIYDDRLLSYSTHLIQTVNTVLKESGFLNETSV